MDKVKVFLLGVKEGFCEIFDMGMTYDQPVLNECYDSGVNVGQALFVAMHPRMWFSEE